MSSEIRLGKFSKYLIQPLKPLGYFISSNYAKTLFIFFISGFVTILFFLIFNKYLVFNTSFTMVFIALLINLLGLNFLMLLNYFIGILSFKFYDISAFNMIKQSIFEFICGTFIPLALFPESASSDMSTGSDSVSDSGSTVPAVDQSTVPSTDSVTTASSETPAERKVLLRRWHPKMIGRHARRRLRLVAH